MFLESSYLLYYIAYWNSLLQGNELNGYGELYIKRHSKLRIKLVDGSSLAAAIVLKSIPKGTTQVLLCGKLNKVAFAMVDALCQSGIQVHMFKEWNYLIVLLAS